MDLTFFNEQMKKFERRIKAIEESPSGAFLKTNAELYRLELESLQRTLEAWKSGQPFGIMPGMEMFARIMGFYPWNYIAAGDRVTDPTRYLEAALQAGYSDHSCDRTLTALGLLLRGEMPSPSLVVSMRFACEPERLTTVAAATHSNALYYAIDNPLGWTIEALEYVTEQLWEIIDLAEKSIPGIKYDEDLLLEILHWNDESKKLVRRNYEMRQTIPCPIGPKDAFRLDYLRGSKRGVEHYERRLAEITERAEKGVGAVKEERLRVAWMATGPYSRDTFKILEEMGVSVPWFHYGGAASMYSVVPFGEGEKRYGRKLKPLERVAELAHFSGWAQTADYWIDPLITVCRELKIDAVVDFLQPGCVVTKGLKKIISSRVKNELGIPVLDLEGRQFFNSPAAQAEMNWRLAEFLELCIQNKETGRGAAALETEGMRRG